MGVPVDRPLWMVTVLYKLPDLVIESSVGPVLGYVTQPQSNPAAMAAKKLNRMRPVW